MRFFAIAQNDSRSLILEIVRGVWRQRRQTPFTYDYKMLSF